MASSPSFHGKEGEALTDFILLGSKINVKVIMNTQTKSFPQSKQDKLSKQQWQKVNHLRVDGCPGEQMLALPSIQMESEQ